MPDEDEGVDLWVSRGLAERVARALDDPIVQQFGVEIKYAPGDSILGFDEPADDEDDDA